MALEAEAVNLANELVNAKMESQKKLEVADEKVSQIQNMFEITHQELAEMQEQKHGLEQEVEKVSNLFKSIIMVVALNNQGCKFRFTIAIS